MANSNYETYVNHLKKLADVEYAIGVLSWDKEVNLPPKGAGFRAQQVATLSGIAHEIFTDEQFENTLNKLQYDLDNLSTQQKRNVEITTRDLSRTKKFNKDFVIRRSQLVSKAYHAWLEARKENKFSLFQEALADLVAIKKEEAEIIGYKDHPYNALLDEFEPGCTTKELDQLFDDVKAQLVDFVKAIREKDQVEDGFLFKHYAEKEQWNFGLEILKKMGYDFDAGRQDLSPHPFTINFSPTDVRVTTRIDEQNFGSMTWSCIHEGGHALYEQGLPSTAYGLPLGRYVSLGIHESQSRLWENNVGRSLAYWKANFQDLKKRFPQNLENVTAEQFYKGINKIYPSLIRVESDELHYHFHILIRYEIEKALIEGNLNVADLPEAWNAKYKAYLDLDVPDDNQGALQDIHWAHGSLGYFPTYSLGSFYAAQFFQQAGKDIPGLKSQIEQGDTSQLLKWLRENIHQHGRFYSAQELCQRITGEPLNFKYFMEYVKEKFTGIYNL
jgi:carboxypeptidase Taq